MSASAMQGGHNNITMKPNTVCKENCVINIQFYNKENNPTKITRKLKG